MPAVLRAWYGVNEIITTLMMSFIGIAVANVLVKGPFRTDTGGVARTDTLPLDDRLPLLGDTQINAGIIIALVAILAVHLLMTRTSLGLRLRVLGANPRAAEHAGLHMKRLTIVAFMASGGLIALGGAVEILGIWGSFRADFNPAFGLIVIPLVFLARLNALGAAFFVAAFSVIQIGGESAARQVRRLERHPARAGRPDAPVHGRDRVAARAPQRAAALPDARPCGDGRRRPRAIRRDAPGPAGSERGLGRWKTCSQRRSSRRSWPAACSPRCRCCSRAWARRSRSRPAC